VLSNFPTEKLKLIKQNSKQILELEGLVSTNNIMIEDASLDIEDGDHFERLLPNGRTESFLVLDNGFMRGFGHGIPDHYQVKVEKVTKTSPLNVTGSGYITVVNDGGKVNINSTDNSINVQISNDTQRIFEELKQVIEDTKDTALMESLEDLKASVGSDSYARKYNSFIQNAANHMTIIAPFLPAISALLVN